MALGSTVFTLELELADVDRSVYETLSLKVAQHPSESDEYLVARMLAFALEYSPDLAFSKGLGTGSEPALWAHDATGQLRSWIEVGTPDAARLHKARKATDDVAVYCHKEPDPWVRALAGQRVHRSETLRLFALDRSLVQRLADAMQRRSAWSLTRSDGVLYVEDAKLTVSAPLVQIPWPEAS